jgi:hypothetical protein
MAKATILKSEMIIVKAGQHGVRKIRGTATWPTTAATCTLPVPGLTVADNVQLTPAAAPATDEQQYWADTLVGGQVSMSASDPVVNLGRTGASPTSGLQFAFEVTGR